MSVLLMLWVMGIVCFFDVEFLLDGLHLESGVCMDSSLDSGLFLLAIYVLVLAEFLKVREANVAVLLSVLSDVTVTLGPRHGRPLGRVGWLRVQPRAWGEHGASGWCLSTWGSG